MKKVQELSLKIEDLEERIAPHIMIAPAEQASDSAQPEGEQHQVHGTIGPGADDWHLKTPHGEVNAPGHEV